jgi:hypothetical protein
MLRLANCSNHDEPRREGRQMLRWIVQRALGAVAYDRRVARLTPPGEPVEFEVPDGERVFHYVVHFADGHALPGATSARDEADAELKVRNWLLTDPGVRGMAEGWGDPGEIEVVTPEEYLTRE